MESPEEKRKRDTLTRQRAYAIAEELASKPLCSDNLVCDGCPLNIEGLDDCLIVNLSMRLRELKGEVA